ncbi:hypothetical protein BpHYR1_031528 [Brachionus plicatilis]|uniref:Uncharacterized protein n=1 Tax=Brachionus plicatilis TaxID=10195 RepID=A0A3M7Q1M8_BRAPC|nr:hypothetical protein BpHYR1_031528 [Brachionus plicatilis]
MALLKCLLNFAKKSHRRRLAEVFFGQKVSVLFLAISDKRTINKEAGLYIAMLGPVERPRGRPEKKMAETVASRASGRFI